MDQKGSGSALIHTIYILVIIILLAIVGGGFYYFNKKLVAAENQIKSSQTRRPEGKMGGMPGMGMTQGTPPEESDQQKQQIVAGISTDSTKKIFNIIGGNYYFVPNKITVNKGDQVTFYVTNAGGVHDLVIDELGVKTPIIKTATTATFQFVASKTGSFVYYCNVPGHRQKGMWGTLTVQ